MFTGIVQGTAKVVSIDDKPNFRTHVVELPAHMLEGLETGASVANNGCCLTVTDINGAPPDILFTAEEVAEQDQADQAQAQAAQIAEALPGIAKATKDFAQARQISQDAPAGTTTGVI